MASTDSDDREVAPAAGMRLDPDGAGATRRDTEPLPVGRPGTSDWEPGPGETPGPDAAGAGRPAPSEGTTGARVSRRGALWFAGILGLVLVVLLGGRAFNVWPSLTNPFAEERTDRSQPPLLQSIQDLSQYVAAEGNFQVVIDLEKDRKYVPDFLINERTLLIGAGTVQAYVDFSRISQGAITESADRTTVEIKLPAPQLGKTNLNQEKSYVFAEQRGLMNRLGDVFGGDPNRQREAYRLAEERITAAARDSGLVLRAEENTRKMLMGLLRSLGYTTVTITFAPAA